MELLLLLLLPIWPEPSRTGTVCWLGCGSLRGRRLEDEE